MADLITREEWQSLPGKSARKETLVSLRKEFSDKDIRNFWGVKPPSYYNLLKRYGLVGKSAEVPDGEDELELERQHLRQADVIESDATHPDAMRGLLELQRQSHNQADVIHTDAVQSDEPHKKSCTVEGCGKPYAAKGYCTYHYSKSRAKKKNKAPTTGINANEHIERNTIPNDKDWPRKGVVDAEYTVIGTYKDIGYLGTDTLKADEPPKPPTAESVDLPFPTIKGTPAQLRKQFEGVSLFLEGLEGESARFEIRLSVVKA